MLCLSTHVCMYKLRAVHPERCEIHLCEQPKHSYVVHMCVWMKVVIDMIIFIRFIYVCVVNNIALKLFVWVSPC